MLPAPTFTCTIGSIHDDTPLDCRIYHPPHWSLSDPHLEYVWKPRGAIIAHPYTALGGSYDDGVVLSAVSEILKAGFVAGTFNFRGAGSSKGRSSWTGKPELVDYISFIGFFVYYLSGLRPLPPPPSPGNSHGHHRDDPTNLPASRALPSPSSPTDAAPPLPPLPPPGITLILGGYSYGSLLTTYLPPARTLLDRFARAGDRTPEARIRSQALDLAARWNLSASVAAASVHGPRSRSVGVVPDPGRMSMGGSERMSGESSGGGKRFDSVIRQSLERSRRRFRSWRPVGDGVGLNSRPSTAGKGEGEGEGAASSIAHDDDDDDQNTVSLQQVCYLLISPLLPPISLFATMFSKPHDDDDRHQHQHNNHHEDDEKSSTHNNPTTRLLTPNLSSPSSPSSPLSNTLPPSTLTTSPTLAIYGTRDFFSSHRKLRAWAEALAARPNSRFGFREVHGAGHFWLEQGREGGVERELRRGIREWVLGLVGGNASAGNSAGAAAAAASIS